MSRFKKHTVGLIFLSRFYASRSNCKKICIVGSGPAGFYTARRILSKSDCCEVDIYEKLPVPFGLARYGVAPDHPENKHVTNDFRKVAQHEKCRFFGNVNIGHDVSLLELRTAYNAVVLAYGASEDNKLEIPGESCPNVFSARRFVGWYNGHPSHVNEKFDLGTEVATVVGHGNVAMDVARILLKNPDQLKSTDIPEYAMDSLVKSRIKKVLLVGRRGPFQASFTARALREMTKLKNCTTVLSPEDFSGVPEILPNLIKKKRLLEAMYNIAVNNEKKKSEKVFEIKFFRSPKEIICESGKLKKMVLYVNSVEGTSENAKVFQSEETEEIHCGLVLRSIGYKTLPLEHDLPFDHWNSVLPNKLGRVCDSEGLYCSGWVKTGPIGNIENTKISSEETAEKVLEDMCSRKAHFNIPKRGNEFIINKLNKRSIRYTTFDDTEMTDLKMIA